MNRTLEDETVQTSGASNDSRLTRISTRSARTRKRLAVLALVAVVLAAPWSGATALAQSAAKASPAATVTQSATAAPATTANPSATTTAASGQPAHAPAGGKTVLLDPDAASTFEINAKSYVLYEAESDTFLLGLEPDVQRSPASITKVMTVLLALERLKLDDTITVTRDMYATIPNDYMRLGLVEGEEFPVEDAVYASLLLSANDTAMALALKVSGSVAEFTALMNERARELGCTGTTFTNPYGLAEPTNLTTAHDMALIMAEALRNEDYVKISLTKNRQFKPTNKTAARGVGNGNRFVTTTRFAYPAFIGGKTGFTNLSGNTMVSGARQDGRTLVTVILGSTASDTRYQNTITLFDHGFSAYQKLALDPAAFEAARSQFVARLESTLKDAGLRFKVDRTEVKLNAHATTTKATGAGGFTARVGDGPDELQAARAGLPLAYPLFADFENGRSARVGTLELSLAELPQTAAPVASTTILPSEAPSEVDVGKASLASTLLRIGGIALAVLLVIGLAILLLMQREKKRRRNNRRNRPRIKRL